MNLSKEYLSEIPIKKITLENQMHFIELTEKMMNLHEKLLICKTPQEEKLLKIQIDKVDEQINARIYELYGLNDDEIDIIENSL